MTKRRFLCVFILLNRCIKFKFCFVYNRRVNTPQQLIFDIYTPVHPNNGCNDLVIFICMKNCITQSCKNTGLDFVLLEKKSHKTTILYHFPIYIILFLLLKLLTANFINFAGYKRMSDFNAAFISFLSIIIITSKHTSNLMCDT